MILGITIQNRLEIALNRSLYPDFDIRYLTRWINEAPKVFPKFILTGNYESFYNPIKMRWEIKATIKN